MSDSVELVHLACNKCGAALDIEAATRFVTCAHCGSRLEVKRTGGAAFTSVLEEIQQKTERIADDVEALRKRAELEALERDWQREAGAGAMSRTAPVVGSIVTALFGVFWMFFAAKFVHAPPAFTAFGLVFIGVSLWNGYTGYHRAIQRETAQREYLRRRDELLR